MQQVVCFPRKLLEEVRLKMGDWDLRFGAGTDPHNWGHILGDGFVCRLNRLNMSTKVDDESPFPEALLSWSHTRHFQADPYEIAG